MKDGSPFSSPAVQYTAFGTRDGKENTFATYKHSGFVNHAATATVPGQQRRTFAQVRFAQIPNIIFITKQTGKNCIVLRFCIMIREKQTCTGLQPNNNNTESSKDFPIYPLPNFHAVFSYICYHFICLYIQCKKYIEFFGCKNINKFSIIGVLFPRKIGTQAIFLILTHLLLEFVLIKTKGQLLLPSAFFYKKHPLKDASFKGCKQRFFTF